MDNKEAINEITGFMRILQTDCDELIEALVTSIKALNQVNHLTGRPCYVCEFHKENGCCKWNCVFEK